ncbi:DNA-directed RNA polymerase I subunit RPA43 [Latimeria chalumnae]|uniref:DNA-directed RNA polymerase subunit n=1 Tax=Latimeria chalumnae TaxID=7897 RepID=H3AQL8_LATCH|nr:PREDICTED: DNA-directed RNA polymerase I subunit RPA43 [Latimeria chalumnae]|eukprot:XP_005991342.1 PREDICTED: DNA-directed RNA polymerase I subunit RPA43 [Latimeria chalumnae]
MANLEREQRRSAEEGSGSVFELQQEVPQVRSGASQQQPCPVPSFVEACALVKRPYSCLVVQSHRRHVALSPMYLQKKKTGIHRQLDAELLKYSESLKGVPVAYDNIRIVGELGDIFDDQGYIHVTIEADFVIFQPKKGKKLMGVVNKVAPSHIGCLVHGCFNASIPKPNQMPSGVWQGFGVKVGDELEFEVFHLDSDAAGVFCVRGKLDRKSVQSKPSENWEEETIGTNHVELHHGAPNTPGKQKKKKRKAEEELDVWAIDSAEVSMAENPSDVAEATDTNGQSEVTTTTKKKQKGDEQEARLETAVHGSDSSGYHSDGKTSKKKKRHLSETELGEVAQEPKAKKKRRE